MSDRFWTPDKPLPDIPPGDVPTEEELEAEGADDPVNEDDPTTAPIDPEI